MNWISKLEKLVKHYKSYPDIPEPGYLYSVDAPKESPWPTGVPQSEDLVALYSVFGGGEIGPMIRLNCKADLSKETSRWFETLHDDDDFLSNINLKASIVVGRDADGTPWFYDTETGRVQSYYWKSGQWEEPVFNSLPEFIEYIFTSEDGGEDWRMVLKNAEIYA